MDYRELTGFGLNQREWGSMSCPNDYSHHEHEATRDAIREAGEKHFGEQAATLGLGLGILNEFNNLLDY